MPATQSERASVSQLVRTPYIQVLTYPRISLRTAQTRVRQLNELGVEELIFEGKTKIGRLGLLGIGTVGLVVQARVGGDVCALKIRRTDANRPSMDDEYRISSFANRIGVGVQVYRHTKDFMTMKLLVYKELHEWMKGLRGPGARAKAREMIHMILNQCRKLDIANLDHGQLSNLRKHIVVAEERPWIIDFESAGTHRKPRNLTTAAQYIFIGSKMSPLVRRTLGIKETGELLRLLREYKMDLTDFTYAKILEWLKIPAG